MTDLTSISSPLPSNSLSQFLRSVELLEDRKPTHGSVRYKRSDRIAGALFDIHTALVLHIWSWRSILRPKAFLKFFFHFAIAKSLGSFRFSPFNHPAVKYLSLRYTLSHEEGFGHDVTCNHPEERESSSHTPSLSQETTSRRRPPAPAVYTEIDLGTYFYPSWDNTACHEHAGIAGVAFSPFFRLPCCDKTRLAS